MQGKRQQLLQRTVGTPYDQMLIAHKYCQAINLKRLYCCNYRHTSVERNSEQMVLLDDACTAVLHPGVRDFQGLVLCEIVH